jgi:hypothetical protein
MMAGASPDEMTLEVHRSCLKPKLLLQRQKSVLHRTFLKRSGLFKSISKMSLLTSRRFNGEIKSAKALWNTLRKVAVAFSLSHSSVGVGGRNGGFVRTVSTLGGLR